MPGRRAIAAITLGLLSAVAAGCSSDERAIRIGLLTDCQGPLYGYEDAQLSGAELPFLHRGARLVGTGPSDGVTVLWCAPPSGLSDTPDGVPAKIIFAPTYRP